MSASNPWEADRTLDRAGAARAIREAVPELGDVDVRLLGSGWDFDAYAVDDRHVFRFPRREDVQPSVQKDLLLLPWLAERVSLPLPRPVWGALRAPSFPYVFAGYHLVRGKMAASFEPTPVLRKALGAQLGRFLRALHELTPPASIVEGGGLDAPLKDPGPVRDYMRKYLPAFREHVPALGARAEAFFDDTDLVPPPYAGPPRLIHADLHAEHVLLDGDSPTRAAGTIDWCDARLGDPARDFACLYSWGGEPMLRAMLVAYGQQDDGLEARARFLGMSFAFMDWDWWHQMGNRTAADAALASLGTSLPLG